MINLVKASAGSGKTFTLAKEYIALLLNTEDEFYYRHILAVTFTNKATEEMKGRILKELNILSKEPSRSKYIGGLMAQFGSEQIISQRAKKVLINILHDYSAFSISTIDKFFQRTLKAFARELGQVPSYQVQLERDPLINESVDRILASIEDETTNPIIFNWLMKNAIQNFKDGKKFNLDKDLKTMAKLLLSEQLFEKAKKYKIDVDTFYSKDNLIKLHALCTEYSKEYTEQITIKLKQLQEAFNTAGLLPCNTTNSFFENFLNKFQKNGLSNPKDISSIENKLNTWYNEDKPISYLFTGKKNKDQANSYEAVLSPLFKDLLYLLTIPHPVYITLTDIKKQLYNLGILSELKASFDGVLQENNFVCLEETNDMLNKLISNTDAPFIYEKLGVRYDSFMLDEFQDTSTIQYENFLPLLKESQSGGHTNLIVGDVKQSIYRFRGGDWTLLGNRLKEDFSGGADIQETPLSTNWRSSKNIIEFNNAFYSFVVNLLGKLEVGGHQLLRLYQNHEQEVSPAMQKVDSSLYGNIEVVFTNKDLIIKYVEESINKVLQAGGNYGQIAILVREKANGRKIAKELISKGIPVVSEDALFIKSSTIIRYLVSLLYLMDAETNDTSVRSYIAKELNITLPSKYSNLADLCEILLRELRQADATTFDGEVLYIEAFMDELKKWSRANGNNLNKFLLFWQEQDPILSSADVSNAVSIMTLHKSKGLEFEHVILPYAESLKLFKDEEKWVRPHFANYLKGNEKYINNEVLSSLYADKWLNAFAKFSSGLYLKNLSSSVIENDILRDEFYEEKSLQCIDAVNAGYVTFTRAKKGLHIICSRPNKTFFKSIEEGIFVPKSFNDLLYGFLNIHTIQEMLSTFNVACDIDNYMSFVKTQIDDSIKEVSTEDVGIIEPEDAEDKADNYITEVYSFGNIYPYGQILTEDKPEAVLPIEYYSYPLNPIIETANGQEEQENRLIFSSDAFDFFGEDGTVGIDSSVRRKGNMLHKILSLVKEPKDVKLAVDSMYSKGFITNTEANECQQLITDAINFVSSRGWFPQGGKGVKNEVSIFDEDGRVYRPDRIVEVNSNDKDISYCAVIDYKFGEENHKYKNQVKKYAKMLQSLGYKRVKAYLWYVLDKKIEEVI